MRALAAVLGSLGVRVQRRHGSADDAVPAGAAPGTGREWWADDAYTRVPRWYEVTWRGRTLARIPYRESIKGNYFKPADDLVSLVREMAAVGLPALEASSRVLEPGCNVGRNLWALRRAFDCEVAGLDISARAIATATDEIWKGAARASFAVADVLDPETFRRFPDGHFDLVLTRWHLIHMPAGPAKRAYVGELQRVGRAGLVLEPVRPSATGQVEWAAGGRYCLSWDDWERAYGLTRFTPRTRLEETEVFYWRHA
jgi:hypothetical protein